MLSRETFAFAAVTLFFLLCACEQRHSLTGISPSPNASSSASASASHAAPLVVKATAIALYEAPKSEEHLNRFFAVLEVQSPREVPVRITRTTEKLKTTPVPIGILEANQDNLKDDRVVPEVQYTYHFEPVAKTGVKSALPSPSDATLYIAPDQHISGNYQLTGDTTIACEGRLLLDPQTNIITDGYQLAINTKELFAWGEVTISALPFQKIPTTAGAKLTPLNISQTFPKTVSVTAERATGHLIFMPQVEIPAFRFVEKNAKWGSTAPSLPTQPVTFAFKEHPQLEIEVRALPSPPLGRPLLPHERKNVQWSPIFGTLGNDHYYFLGRELVAANDYAGLYATPYNRAFMVVSPAEGRTFFLSYKNPDLGLISVGNMPEDFPITDDDFDIPAGEHWPGKASLRRLKGTEPELTEPVQRLIRLINDILDLQQVLGHDGPNLDIEFLPGKVNFSDGQIRFVEAMKASPAKFSDRLRRKNISSIVLWNLGSGTFFRRGSSKLVITPAVESSPEGILRTLESGNETRLVQ